MGTYIGFLRKTRGTQLRLSLLLIAILHLTLTKASLLPIVVSGQAEVGWDRTIGDGKRPSGLGGETAATTVVSNKLLVWLGSREQQQQRQQHGGTMSAAAAVAGLSGSPALHRPRHPYSGGIGATRAYYVHNKCSGGYVRVLDDGVDAAGRPADDAAHLVFETAENHLVRIRRQNSSYYLCFNHMGKLVTKTEPTELCLFNDTLTESHHTELQLAAASAAASDALAESGRSDWLVGFRKAGKPWRGYDHQLGRPRRCFQFTKRQIVRPADYAGHQRDPPRALQSGAAAGGRLGEQQQHSRPPLHGWQPASGTAADAATAADSDT